MEHKYYNLQPTLMLKNTVFVNENAYAGNYKPGILMDIFIYDNLPEDKKKAELIIKKMSTVQNLIYCKKR